MPEGDTVYRLAGELDAALGGSRLTGCDIRVPAFAATDLTGELVRGVASRGKHILMRVGEYTIHSHLKMEGTWRLYRHGARWQGPAHEVRAVLQTADRVAVGSRLGMLDVVTTDGEADLLRHLGPDLLGDWDADEAVRRLATHPDKPIAVALLDQRNLAGLGNEYVAELCFLRGMLPTRPVREVDLSATVELAHRLILANRDRVIRVTTGDARRGRTSWVHGRGSRPCLRCGALIRRGRIGRTDLEQRVTFFCPHCQH